MKQFLKRCRCRTWLDFGLKCVLTATIAGGAVAAIYWIWT